MLNFCLIPALCASALSDFKRRYCIFRFFVIKYIRSLREEAFFTANEYVYTLGIRELTEKLVPYGDIDNRRGAFRVIESLRLHKKLQKEGGAVYAPEVNLKKDFEIAGMKISLVGRADGVIQEEALYFIDEIKCINLPISQIEENFCPTHTAQVMCYAYIYACDHGLDRIGTQLTYCDIVNEDTVRFRAEHETEALGAFVDGLLQEFVVLESEKLSLRRSFSQSAKRLSFPYGEYRAGQREFVEYAFEAMCTSKKLFAEAPTGIGKTMAVLFPAIKALGNGFGEKIFYFTSKTTIAEAAEAAYRLMCRNGLKALCITVSAKERICKNAPNCCDPDSCPKARGHFERVREAVLNAVRTENSGSGAVCFTSDTIKKYAEQFNVCPYELSLDISEYCELVICDYNYLFDPKVYFRRYFSGRGDYIFLVDEAHNLADRARDMYTCELSTAEFESALMRISPEDKYIFPKLYEVLSYMKTADRLVEIEERRLGKVGTFLTPKPLGILNRRLKELTAALEAYFRFVGYERTELDDLYCKLKDYLKISEFFDERFLSRITYKNGELSFGELCIDPSGVISHCLSKGRSAVLFSATLSPSDYFVDLLGGGENDLTLVLDSPFPRENLCVCTVGKFSTRFEDRTVTVNAVADMLAELVGGKSGNYIAFFPSYKYMMQVYEIFDKKYKSVRTIVQQSGMSEKERKAFLKSFESADAPLPEKPKSKLDALTGLGLVRGSALFGKGDDAETDESTNEKSLLAFGVLGGAFAEGVDYLGDRLIGCAIVGVGLPGLNDFSNIIRDYYDRRADDDMPRGYDYAYRIPGMIKVLQAAGRVIRSENDRGVVLLIDDRYSTREYSRFYPEHWKPLRRVGNKRALGELLRRFWNNEL